MALLETQGLSKAFGGLRAVHELDLRVELGEIVGMIGPNGSGKTTVFNLLTGIYRSTAGRMTFLTRDGSPADLAGLPSHAITALGSRPHLPEPAAVQPDDASSRTFSSACTAARARESPASFSASPR